MLGPALNPLTAPIAEIKEFAKDKIQEAIEEELHIDIDQLKSFVTSRRTGSSVAVRLPRAARSSARSSSTSSSRTRTRGSTR